MFITILLGSLFVFNLFSNTINKTVFDVNPIFDEMELQEVDITKPLLYGYFFIDNDKSKLEVLYSYLKNQSFSLIRLEKVNNMNYLLQIEKIEIHSRQSLEKRLIELKELSRKYKVSVFDGWEVGSANLQPLVKKSIERNISEKNKIDIFESALNNYNNGKNKEAIKAFQKCINYNYKVDVCYFKQGNCYIDLGNIEFGIKKLNEAINFNPKYFEAYFNLGAVYYDIQMFEKSIEYYEKARLLKPKNDNVIYGIAASQFALGRLNESKLNCQYAIKLNPNNKNAKDLLDRINQESN
ncbi:MAG: tetratricopeptide repeat protein [Candidatus Kapabacteria bacterium]|nr:tetratricopeptide repeat protein [Candidatus Kapabacteria bacterium]